MASRPRRPGPLAPAQETLSAACPREDDKPPESIEIPAPTCLQAYDSPGKPLWRKDLGTTIAAAHLIADRRERPRVILALSRKGPAAGDVVAFDGAGNELWRQRPVRTSPYADARHLSFPVKSMLVADLLPEPGTEIVLTRIGSWFPSHVGILSEGGTLPREMWRPGVLDGPVRIGAAGRLVFWGCNSAPPRDGSTRNRDHSERITRTRTWFLGALAPNPTGFVALAHV